MPRCPGIALWRRTLAILFLLLAAADASAWWNTSWSRRRKLTFDNSAQPENLLGFQVLVVLNSSRIDYAKTRNDGFDLRFVDSNDSTVLDYEIEKWDESGNSYVWVRVPQIDLSSSTDFIWMYYGNAGAANVQNAAAVWAGYSVVHHLDETSGPHLDSTSNGNNSSVIDVQTQASPLGIIDGADVFSAASTDNVDVPDSASLDMAAGDSFLVEAWINTVNAGDQMVVDKESQGTPGDGEIQLWTSGGNASFWLNDGAANARANSATAVANGAWHYLVGRWNEAANTAEVFVDGVSVASASNGLGAIATTGTPLVIGQEGDANRGFDFDGRIDEVRVAKVFRTDNWIKAQNKSMRDNAFVNFGPEVTPVNYRSIGTVANYSTGTANATSGATNVTGTGTAWKTANRGRGDRLTIPCPNPPTCTGGVHYTVHAVASDASLFLTTPFTGATGPYTYMLARQFTTLSAWEDCIDGGAGTCAPFPNVTASLVADDRSEVGIAYNDSVFTLAGNVVIDGSTTDATHTITLTVDPGNRHNGSAGTGVRVNANLTTNEIHIVDDNVTLEWFEIYGFRGGSTLAEIRVIGPAANNVLLQNLLLHDFYDGPGAGDANGIRLSGSAGKSVTVRNTMIWDGDTFGIAGDELTDTLLVENCSINWMHDAGSRGIYGQLSAVTVRNTIVANTTAANYQTAGGTIVGSNNTSSDATAPALFTNGQTAAAAAMFVLPDVVNANLHLKAGANVALDTGLDLSPAFFADIDGQRRPAGAAWDRGADERDATTEVKLQSFSASRRRRSVRARVADGVGARQPGLPRVPRPCPRAARGRGSTASLIPGLGSSAVGQAYSCRDAGLLNGTRYFYRLEDVDASSKTTSHGPVSAVPLAGVGRRCAGPRASEQQPWHEAQGRRRADLPRVGGGGLRLHGRLRFCVAHAARATAIPRRCRWASCRATRDRRRSSSGPAASTRCTRLRAACACSCPASTSRRIRRPPRCPSAARSWTPSSGAECSSAGCGLSTRQASRASSRPRSAGPRCRCRGTARCAPAAARSASSRRSTSRPSSPGCCRASSRPRPRARWWP